MDWKRLNSVIPEELNDSEKDELFNSITWYNYEADTNLTIEKCTTLIKLSQELLKYKGEQVETLLAELDEIAIKEAEQESKKSEDIKSVRSKRSQSSLEIDDLEDKIKELKHKLRQQFKVNEKQKTEIDKLQRKISMLENENKDLQNEIKVLDKDDAQSDISETIKDQHKDLIDSIHEKNKQISQLLDDIESTEKENVLLKEKLTTVRDELAEATKQLNIESNLTSSLKLQIESQSEKIEKQLKEIEVFKAQVQEFEEEKTQHNLEVERFKNDIETKIEEWKDLLSNKNEEIRRLKEYHNKLSSSHSTSTLSEEYDKSEINILTKIINEREEKILELQEQLQTATKDIEENTKTIENLMHIKNSTDTKIKELNLLVKDLKKQNKGTHNRCQEIQNNLKYAEKLIRENEENFNHLRKTLEDGGQIETSDLLKSNRLLKTQNMQKDKQIEDLVKAANKLQESVDGFEQENVALKQKLSLPEDATVTGIKSVVSKQQKQKKVLQLLYKQNSELEEEKINLKLKNKELSKVISKLFNGNEIVFDTSQQYEGVGNDEVDNVSYSEITEENAALRKGLHEILDTVRAKDSTGLQEIKSETLEKLLRALDVKHVSGWYHPAMRLQAELHTLEGTNAELREQLRLARLELSKYMESPRSIEHPILNIKERDLNNSEIISNLNQHLLTVLNNYKIEETTNKALIQKIEHYREEFSVIHQQIVMLYKQYSEEKSKFMKQDEELNIMKTEFSTKIHDLQQEVDIYRDFSNLENDELAKKEKLKEMATKIVTLNRKCIFLENSDSKLSEEVKKLKENLLNSETNYISKINKLDAEKKELCNKISKIENLLNNMIEKHELANVQDSLDKLTLKYRELLQSLSEVQNKHRKELDVLQESNNMYKKEKEELNSKLVETLNNLHTFEEASCNVDNAVQVLTKKLAQSEVNEITERQRGNHINNLYELVKEQLKNSEDRYTEFEKFNKEIMRKNLHLQENVKDLQDRIINYVDLTAFDELKTRYDSLLEEQKVLIYEKSNLKEQLELTKKKNETISLWNSLKEYEFLNLKHQIVDLQSNSDEKAIIARLSSDVVNARLSESECRKIIENFKNEVNKQEVDLKNYETLLNEERLKNEKLFIGKNKKISELQNIIKQQRLNYYGSVPLICETHFIDNLHKAFCDKHEAFLILRNAQEYENDTTVLKNQLLKHISILDELKSEPNANKILQWYQEKKNLQLQELRHKRYAEFKDNQLQQAMLRLSNQEKQIEKLEEELLQAYQKPELFLENMEEIKDEDDVNDILLNVEVEQKKESKLKMFKTEEIQTSFDLLELKDSDSLQADVLNKLQNDVTRMRRELENKEKTIEEYKAKITELELNISMFKTQIGDKQSQIMFYEKHILELNGKLEIGNNASGIIAEKIDGISEKGSEEIAALKGKINDLQNLISQKEETVINLQSLLKRDRDEHSLAAARMQDEVKKLQSSLHIQQKSYSNETFQEGNKEVHQPNFAVIEQYVRQVHALEQHTTELHGNISTLNSQLLTSQEEIVHWKTLANERLQNIDTVRTELEDKYKRENATYKKECEKWREEIRNLNQIICSYRESANEVKIDITQLLKDKDDQIHKLTGALRQMQKELRKKPDVDTIRNDILAEFEENNLQIAKEYDALKKKYEQLMARERKAREEIRNLRSQLIKRPVLSARSDRSDSSREQQLIKKASSLERDVDELKEKLEKQIAINESHRVKVDEDFDKWNKQKQWQQTAEKLKMKLKDRNEEYDKLQHTCSGYRILIERLEKEKYSLENRIKYLKNRNINASCNNQLEALELENVKLLSQVDMLTSKLDMQHHHSGGLAAAMLQEKLEAQERKIAVLELSAKCPLEVRSEIERLHNTLANLQKKNLQLEAQNLEVSLDLQKCRADTPHLREQIQYLESYIEVLKTENTTKHKVDNSGDHVQQNVEAKKISELERTVFILKRLVEKLQAENKRLNSGSRLCIQTSTSSSLDVLRKENQHLKEQYGECIQKNVRLEQELNSTKNTLRSLQNKPISETLQTLTEQLNEAKLQLAQKSELLDKVKVLLHRAASKEKALMEEITLLRQNGHSDASENQSVHSA